MRKERERGGGRGGGKAEGRKRGRERDKRRAEQQREAETPKPEVAAANGCCPPEVVSWLHSDSKF